MSRIAILDRDEHEHEHRDAEDEYEKKREQCGAPKSPVVLSWLFESWSPATSLTTVVIPSNQSSSERRDRCHLNRLITASEFH